MSCEQAMGDEIFEMVTRQYADVVQDDLLAPHFAFGSEYMDWQALIGTGAWKPAEHR